MNADLEIDEREGMLQSQDRIRQMGFALIDLKSVCTYKFVHIRQSAPPWMNICSALLSLML